MASFVLPEVNDDPEGWGPASNSVPEHLKYLVRPCCRAGALPASPPPAGLPAHDARGCPGRRTREAARRHEASARAPGRRCLLTA